MSPQNDSIPAARRLIEAARQTLTEGAPANDRRDQALSLALSLIGQDETRQAEDDLVREWLSARYDREFSGPVVDQDREAYRRSKAFWEKHLAQVAPPAPVDRGVPHLAAEIIGPDAPQPSLSTRWFTADGEQMKHEDGYWTGWINGLRFLRHWNELPESIFPLRRDLDAEALAQTEEVGA